MKHPPIFHVISEDRNVRTVLIFLALIACMIWAIAVNAQIPNHSQIPEPLCKYCKVDTTGGYISIYDTVLHNPICNYELLTKSHLTLVHSLKIDRATIPFYPTNLNSLYKGSGYSRGHVLPFEDLAWSNKSAKASMDLRRNLAPQPQPENIGTKLACENRTRTLADSLGAVRVYGGTLGVYGNMKGVNEPKYYWTIIVADKIYPYLMSTHTNIAYADLHKCLVGYNDLVNLLGFDPVKLIASKAKK